MIYISIDNDYHGSMALSLIKKYKWDESNICFICQKSRRNTIIPKLKYKSITVEPHPLSDGAGYKRIRSYFVSWKHQLVLKNQVHFAKGDLLILMTEYQLNNPLFARQMTMAQGQVYLLDEGMPYYFNNSPYHRGRTSLRDRLFLYQYNLAYFLLNIPAYTKKGFEGKMFIRIREKYIHCTYSSMKLPIDRELPVRGYESLLVSESQGFLKDKNVVIFFANNFECFGLKEEEKQISKKAIEHLLKTFSKVFVKIHPGDCVDKSDVYFFYNELVASNPGLTLIDNSITGKEAIYTHRPAVVVASMSSTLFDAFFIGTEPIFLYHFLRPVAEFGVSNFILGNLGYRFVSSIEEISGNYTSGVERSNLTFEKADISL